MKTAILDGGQTGMDVVGLIPGVGKIADGVNAHIYIKINNISRICEESTKKGRCNIERS